jgi:hypothetical protein
MKVNLKKTGKTLFNNLPPDLFSLPEVGSFTSPILSFISNPCCFWSRFPPTLSFQGIPGNAMRQIVPNLNYLLPFDLNSVDSHQAGRRIELTDK